MRTPPPDVAIHFPTPNYVDPELRSEGLFATLVAMSALSLIAVSARLYARIRVKRWLGLDDAMIVPALVSGPCTRSQYRANYHEDLLSRHVSHHHPWQSPL